MNAFRRLATAISAALLLVGAAAAGPALAAGPAKIDNALARPLAADGGAFLRAALQQPAPGSCDVLSPDPQYVEEMLVRFDASGAKSFEKRVAFVVGNGAYRNISTLINPPNDAASMAKMFRALGFTVYRAVDVTEAGLNSCFARFREDLERSEAAGEKAAVSLFFYAGHGVQLTPEGKAPTNYMLAVDAKVDAAGKATGFKQIDPVLSEMRAHSEQALFLYDACRNAPFGAGAVKIAEGKAVRAFDASGAAPIEAPSETASQAGLFIAYATSPGKTADDAWGPEGSAHSPFTQALLDNLAAPGIVIDEAMVRARSDVGVLTDRKQTPWTSSSKTESVFLNGSIAKEKIESEVAKFADQSAARRGRGQRGGALAAALKGQPRDWDKGGPEYFSARAALSQADDDRRVSFASGGAAAISPDGTLVAAASAIGAAKVWSAATGEAFLTLDHGGPFEVDRLQFSSSGRLLMTASSAAVNVWNARSGARVASLAGRVGAFSRDESSVVTADRDGQMRIWNTATAGLRKTLRLSGGWIGDVAFSPDGKFVGATAEGGILIYDAESGTLLRTLATVIEPDPDLNQTQQRPARVFRIAWSPDGARICASGENFLSCWDSASGALLPGAGFTGRGTSLGFRSDGSAVAWGENVLAGAYLRSGELMLLERSGAGARLVDTRPKNIIANVLFGLDRVRHADVDLDSKATLIVTASNRTPDAASAGFNEAILWNAANGELVRRLTGHAAPVTAARFSPNGRSVLTASQDGTAIVFDATTGAAIRRFDGGEPLILVAWSGDGTRIAGAGDSGAIVIWDAGSGAVISRHSAEKAPVRIEFSEDGRGLYSLSAHGALELFGASAPLGGFGGEAAIVDFAVSQAGRLVVARGGEVWSGPTRLVGPLSAIARIAFTPDGRRLSILDADGKLLIVDAVTGAAFETSSAHSGATEGLSVGETGTVATKRESAIFLDYIGRYGPDLLAAAYDLLTDELKAEVERERIRYWEIDPELLQ